ncbi:UAA transporter family protein [Thermosipho melanesiensis]|uniref:EamA domain-containing protein n=2 Tax=Thermosipho melanesiensis TaxID=46541 RepID=A6LNI9_THEM4|nr:DMT family transporter [Thermosipho melanesiensis]ABR31490.1 protein of unknown function DUF6, transmembrane [Thermosipho melanesiensis BI429]APT74547.1 UAA transporter family protein [Thermosipho melanesiensis]OOC36497.1 UAA transporter family protein [Thermosipho melanesiensis]OOC37315.1 UAA transporter family protein [Thermosipho melanesiensis]OOC38068.1 UAA transporter family protein [Thermosipho melanesiensis]
MHIFSAIVSAFSSSVTSIFGKLSFTIGATPLQILFIRFLFSFLFAFILFFLLRKKFSAKLFLFFGSLGILNYGIAAFLFFYGLTFLNPAYATVLFFTNPIFVLIIQWIFFKTQKSFFSALSIIFSFLGVILANIAESIFGSDNIIYGTFLVLGAAFLNALFISISGEKIKSLSTSVVENVFYTFLGTFVFYFLVILLFGQVHSLKLSYFPYGILLSVFSTFLPLSLNYFSLKKVESHSLAVIMPLEIVFASVLSYLIFKETFSLIKVIGFVFVGIAPVIDNLKNLRKS